MKRELKTTATRFSVEPDISGGNGHRLLLGRFRLDIGGRGGNITKRRVEH